MDKFVPKLKKSFTRILVNEEEFIVPNEIAEMVSECMEFRKISEGRNPKQLLEYIQKLHEKLYNERNEDESIKIRKEDSSAVRCTCNSYNGGHASWCDLSQEVK